MLVMTVGQARIFMIMGADGLLPRWFARVDPKFKTPANGTWLTGLAAAVIGGLFPVRIHGELGVDRYPARVHHCVPRGSGAPVATARATSAVSGAVALVHLPRWRDRLYRHDPRVAPGYVDPISRLRHA
jgi:hypothetical protein